MEAVKTMIEPQMNQLVKPHFNQTGFITRMEMKAMLMDIDRDAITKHFIKLQSQLQKMKASQ